MPCNGHEFVGNGLAFCQPCGDGLAQSVGCDCGFSPDIRGLRTLSAVPICDVDIARLDSGEIIFAELRSRNGSRFWIVPK